MSNDFFTQLEQQLLEAARRDVAAPPGTRRRAAHAVGDLGLRTRAALPAVAAAACMALVAGLALTMGGEEPARTATGAPPLAPAPRVTTPTQPGARVFVLNATQRDGVAGAAARRLEVAGARVVGTGNAPVNTARTTTVHADRGTNAGAVADRLGVAGSPRPLTPKLRALTAGADVVVVLGRDYDASAPVAVAPPLPKQQVNLRPLGPKLADAVGYALIADGGLAFQAEGLPPGDEYALWLYTSDTDALSLGFAGYDRKTRRLSGTIQKLPPTASRYGSLIVTEEETTGLGDTPGRILLRGPVERG